ncbi:hypothetical protein [Phormidesmis sp. 146-33]
MNINVGLSTTACFLLSAFASVFFAGFKYGEEHAARVMPRSIRGEIVCPARDDHAC